MRVVTYSEARTSLKSVLNQNQSIMETMRQLSTPANAAGLAKGIAQDRRGGAKRCEQVSA